MIDSGDPYNDGRDCAAYDIREICCPYSEGTTERAQWLQGYRDQVAQELIERPYLDGRPTATVPA